MHVKEFNQWASVCRSKVFLRFLCYKWSCIVLFVYVRGNTKLSGWQKNSLVRFCACLAKWVSCCRPVRGGLHQFLCYTCTCAVLFVRICRNMIWSCCRVCFVCLAMRSFKSEGFPFLIEALFKGCYVCFNI